MYSTFEALVSESSEDDSDSSYEQETIDPERHYINQTHFLNMTKLEDYEKNRDRLFTKDILKKARRDISLFLLVCCSLLRATITTNQ